MMYSPITPFRRAIDAARLEHTIAAEAPLPSEGVDKWAALRELSVAKAHFGITDRQLGVLQALLTFHPPRLIGPDEPTIVFPSNASICERLNGMPCSTMRRHLARLVDAGLIVRRDSPNGKRYKRRYGDEAFGFDLAPLALRFAEITAAAEAVRVDEAAMQRLRQSISLMRRDLVSLAGFGEETCPRARNWSEYTTLAAEAAGALRRVPVRKDLEVVADRLKAALDAVRDGLKTHEMSIKDVSSERHYQSSNKDISDSEPCLESEGRVVEVCEEADEARLPNVSLALVLTVCAEFKAYLPEPVRHWHELVQAAEILRPMLGVSASAWDEARAAMGPEEAAVVLLAMLERQEAIRSPGAYLRHLARRAADGEFSCGPMVMALRNREAA